MNAQNTGQMPTILGQPNYLLSYVPKIEFTVSLSIVIISYYLLVITHRPPPPDSECRLKLLHRHAVFYFVAALLR